MSFLADGVLLDTVETAPWQVAWDPLGHEGKTILGIDVLAQDGGTCEDAVTVEVVPGPFRVSIVEPQDGATVSGLVAVEAAIGGGNGAEFATLVVDGRPLGTLVGEPWSWTWDSTAAPDGTSVVEVQAYERKTKRMVSDSVTVQVSNGP